MASRLFRLRPFCGGDRRCSRTRIAGCAPDRRVHLGTSGCFFAIGAPHKQAVAKLLSYPPCRDPGFRLASRTQMTLSNCCDCCGCSGAVADRRWWARTVSACRYQNGIKMNFSQGIVVAHGKPEGHPPAWSMFLIARQAVYRSKWMLHVRFHLRSLGRGGEDEPCLEGRAVDSHHVLSPRDFRTILRAGSET